MTSLNSAPFSKSTDSTIYNVFPELNQGKRYLQKQTEVQKKIDKTRKFIESFSPYNKRGQLKKCRAVGQASPNKHVPCACGNAMCTSSTPYCNYQLGACFPTSANQNQAIEDWDVNSNCAGDGRFSSCEAKAGCSNYGYCPPHIDNTLQWQKDRARASDPNGGDLQLNSLVSQQIMRKADYMSNVQDYVLMPPPCNGDLANCPANPPYYGRNVTIPQQSGVAPYGPGYPHPACGLEVLGNPGDGGKAAVSRTQVESLDATCHAEPDCVGFGKKSGGGWDFLTWNANPTYSGPKDPRMKTPGDYPKYFYIQNPVTGCNSSQCCGIPGTPGNCKTDPYDPACYVPGGAPPVPNTPTPTAPPPSPPIAGGWSNWSTSCPPPPSNIQTRTCTRPPPAYDGPDCSALDGGNAYRSCNAPVKGGWSDWTTECPPAPGNQQTRSCTKPAPAHGGAPCSGARSRPCFSPSTFSPTKSVKGGWSDWTTECPPPPKNQQTRSCTKPAPAYGGAPCSGSSSRPCFSPSTFSPTKPPPSGIDPSKVEIKYCLFDCDGRGGMGGSGGGGGGSGWACKDAGVGGNAPACPKNTLNYCFAQPMWADPGNGAQRPPDKAQSAPGDTFSEGQGAGGGQCLLYSGYGPNGENLPGDHTDSFNSLIAVMKENNAIPGMAGYSDANLQGIFGSFNTNDPGLWPRKWANDDGSMCMFETQPSSVCIAQTGQWPTNWTYTNVGDIFDSLFPKGNKWLKPPAGFTDPKFLNALKCCVGPGQPGSCPPGTQCPGPRSGWPGTVFPTT